MASDPHVYDIGSVFDTDRQELIIGVDHGLVVVREPGQMSKRWRLEEAESEELAKLLVAAAWDAGRQTGREQAESVSDP